MAKALPNIFTNPPDAVEEYKNVYETHWSEVFKFYCDVFTSPVTDYCKSVVAVYGPHQKRLAKILLEKVSDLIERAKPWNNSYSDFEVLYESVKRMVAPFKGPVTLYDIALRIGMGLKPKVLPEKYVYITSETVCENANKILGIKVKRGDKISATHFPIWLQTLPAYQIEDFLCHVRITLTPTGLEFKVPGFSPGYTNFYPENVRKETATIGNGKYDIKHHPIY